MSYSEMEKVEAGLKFKTKSGCVVETTGTSVHLESHDAMVHEVVITEGVGEGHKFLHNLDIAEQS